MPVATAIGMLRFLLISFALCLGTACRIAAPQPASPGNARARLEADVRFLADDALEGRGTPSRGLDTAALYLETELRLARVRTGFA